MGEKEKISFSIQKTAYVVLIFWGLGLLIYFGKAVLVPLAFAFLVSFILYPICTFLEKKNINRRSAVFLSMMSIILLTLGLLYFFSSQVVNIIQELSDFSEKLQETLNSTISFLNNRISILPNINKEELQKTSENWLSNKSDAIAKAVFSNASTLITNISLSIIYAFLILLYRKGLKDATMSFVSSSKKKVYNNMIACMQKVGQKYLTGMVTLIIILGLLNSLGLLILGIENAFFFGYLAATLAIVPYVGTLVGAAIPALYAFLNYDSLWYPVGVILIFWFIQILEANFLSPFIVGSNLSLNALVAILALIIGGAVWGVAGMILALPYTAIFKVFCEHYKELTSISLLLKDDLYDSDSTKFNIKDKLLSIFSKKS